MLLGTELSTLRLLVKGDNYHVFCIHQDNGKLRTVEEPTGELRRIHARLFHLLSRVQPPAYLHSGTKGRSYITNAAVHVARGKVIKTDITKFYPSTTTHQVFVGMLREFKCSGDVANLMAEVCTFNGHVPTGSPVSMAVSFYAHKQVFDQIDRRMQARGITMTLYVDDLTFSGNHLQQLHLCFVKKSMQTAGLVCHKTRCFGSHEPKPVTGAIVCGDRLVLPNRRHLRIIEGIRRLEAASSLEERRIVGQRLWGQINEAASVEARSRARLPGLRALVRRLSTEVRDVR